MDTNGIVQINTILQTPQRKALNITKLDILSTCLCNSDKEFNEHLCFELDHTHQFIRHNKSECSYAYNSPVSAHKRPLTITTPPQDTEKKPKYGPKTGRMYGPLSLFN